MKYIIIDKRQRVDVDTMGEFPTADVRIMEELDKKGIPHDFAYTDTLEFSFINGETSISANGKVLKEYSHIILRGHALESQRSYEIKRYIIDYADNHNIKVLNSKAIKFFPYYNKIALAQICSEYNIPYFNTYYRLDGDYTKERDVLNEYPLICKEYAGANRTQAIDGKEKIKKNVYKIDNEEGYKQEFLKDQDLKNFFIQEFSPAGMDMRIFVKRGKAIAGWKRYAKDGFNTVSKGEYEMYNKPDKQIKRIAERVAKIFKADFIAVDFMEDKDGNILVQEISLHPGFKAYETKIEGTPVNIAEAIITSF
jgi:glutathione synthase/RimK-type ligase-like ATP-grasp enzyme